MADFQDTKDGAVQETESGKSTIAKRVERWRKTKAKQGGKQLNVWLEQDALEALEKLTAGQSKAKSAIVNKAILIMAEKIDAGEIQLSLLPKESAKKTGPENEQVKELQDTVHGLQETISTIQETMKPIQDTDALSPETIIRSAVFQDTVKQSVQVTIQPLLEKIKSLEQKLETKSTVQDTIQSTVQETVQPAKPKASFDLSEDIQIQLDQLRDALAWDLSQGQTNTRTDEPERQALALPVVQALIDTGIKTAGKIAQALNAAGVPTVRVRTGNENWNKSTIQRWFDAKLIR